MRMQLFSVLQDEIWGGPRGPTKKCQCTQKQGRNASYAIFSLMLERSDGGGWWRSVSWRGSQVPTRNCVERGLLQPDEQNRELGKNRSGCFSLLSFRSFPAFSDVRIMKRRGRQIPFHQAETALFE